MITKDWKSRIGMSSDESYHKPPAKRLKCIGDDVQPKLAPSWKIYATESLTMEGRVFGLQDIFFTRNLADEVSNNMISGNGQHENYTFRMEHRYGGPMSKFRGEERILLFRSDKAGAVAKIIYSSEAPDEHGAEPVVVLQEGQTLPPHVSIAHAKIHVLDVKAQYRGRDLGGLLFSEAITSLKTLYCNEDDDEVVDTGGDETRRKKVYDVECSLDAEEDITRHGKLVKFYE